MRPLQKNLENYNALFRKTWMRVPLYAAAFGCFYYGGTQLPARLFPKFTPSKFHGIDHAYYTSSQDVVSKFRLFETHETPSEQDGVTSYLSVYTTEPLTKNEMIDSIALNALKEFDLGKMFQVKRAGKDKNDLFWSFGKVHGLENLAFADAEEVRATKGNPVKIQKIVDKIDGYPAVESFEHLVGQVQTALKEYREKVDQLGMNPSDKKKILSLPFYLTKRSQLPEPRRGQKEFDLFTEMTGGKNWYHNANLKIDEEYKITEFDYENYFDQSLLPKKATESPEFRKLIKVLNLFSETEHERHEQQKESFKKLMPILRTLTAQEQEAFIHKLRNSNRSLSDVEGLLSEMTFHDIEEKLAKLSEEENFNAKNRYRLQKTKLDYAEKKRQPIDESKLKDVLRNQPAFKAAIDQEIGNYESVRRNPQFENGVLTYLNEATYGEMRDLVRDVGINSDNLTFMNVGDLQKKRDQLFVHGSDHNFGYLMNALFTPLDMTDYENTFVGFNEIGGGLPINTPQLLRPVIEEPWPQSHGLVALEPVEKRPLLARSKLHKELLEAKIAEAEADGDEDEDEEEGGEEEEGEGEEEAEEEAGGEEEETVEEEYPPKERIQHLPLEDRYFQRGEKLRSKFNEVELDSFMKLLNIKPHKQWQDTTTHHYKLGAHTYEDDSQHLDPAFHILAEVERQHQERIAVEEFRKGSEVKFELSKRPAHYNYRF